MYDAQRRLAGVVCSSHTMDYELQLDAYGNATNVLDATGNFWQYEYGYNSILLREEFISTGGTQFIASAMTNILSRFVDQFDRPSGFAFSVNEEPQGSIVYAYDDAGDLTHITATNSAGRSFSVAYTNVTGYSYGYTITTPSGDTIRRAVARDDCRRSLVTNCATYFNSSLVDSYLYAFDALSRPTTRTTGTTGVPPVDSTFAYNNRSEVVSAAIGTNLFTHAYDDIGNHLLFGDNAATNTYTHNNLNQITTSLCPPASPRTIHHNADGGLSSDDVWTYAYDAEDQLRSVTSRSLTNGAIRVRNTYDYRHRRTSKTVQRLNVATALPPSPPVELREWETLEMRTFVYDDWNLIHETVYTVDSGVTNVTEIQYFWGLDLSGTIQGAGGVGGLLAVSRNGLLYFPTFDNNGNVTKYIDESGNVVAAYEYDDFGRTISQSGPLADFFRHRFSTKYYDPETGLYYYGYRFYSPDWRIWLNRDPIEEEGGLALYVYCKNNTLGMTDLFGTVGVRVVSYFEAGFWERITSGDKIIQRQVSSASEIPITLVNSSSIWGQFRANPNFYGCDVVITLDILIRATAIERGKSDTIYYYTPHILDKKGFSSTSDGTPQVKGAILAHERGHAEAFFNTILPRFEALVRDLPSSATSEIESRYNQAWREGQEESARLANEAHINWYRTNGYKLEIKK